MSEPEKSPRWRRIAKAILPVNWRAIVAWAAMAAVAYPVNCLLRKHDIDPIPIPPPPAPLWPDGLIAPDQTTVTDDHALIRGRQGFVSFAETPAAAVDMMADDRDVLLYRAWSKSFGRPLPARNQGGVGSCTSFGGTMAAECSIAATGRLSAVELSQEALYAASRVDAQPGRRNPFDGDGATGSAVAKALTSVGVLPRKVYGSHDLSTYSVARCRQWGDNGLPSELLGEAKKRKFLQVAVVKSAEDVHKAIRTGHAVYICSSVGFATGGQTKTQRDADGFSKPSGQWMHCMGVIGYRGGARKGFLIVNSWGADCAVGPVYPPDQPPATFWCDWDVMDQIVKNSAMPAPYRHPDSFAVAGPSGFESRKLRVDDWIVSRPLGGFDRAYVDRLGVDLFGFLRR